MASIKVLCGVLLAPAAFLVALPCQAGIYKCFVDGKTIITDKPCADQEQREQNKLDEQKWLQLSVKNSIAGTTGTEYDLINDANNRSAIERGRARIGMTREQARRAWGAPTKINESIGAGGSREQWVYRGKGGESQYLYFNNGTMSGAN